MLEATSEFRQQNIDGESSLQVGAIVGIVITCVVIAVILIIVLSVRQDKQKSDKSNQEEEVDVSIL